MTNSQDNGQLGKLVLLIKAVGGVLTAAAAVIGALAAMGFFDDDRRPQDVAGATTVVTTVIDPADGAAATSTAPQPTTQATTPELERTTVNLFYAGDLDGCLLSISVSIGDQTALPVGNSYPMVDVLTGNQPYTISGTISCPTFGQCEANGSGRVEVAPQKTFAVQWLNVAFAGCEITLIET